MPEFQPASQNKKRSEDFGRQPGPQPILFVNYHGTIGGGQVHLMAILDELDRGKFTPHIVCCQDGLFADMLRSKGFEPIIVPFGKAKLRYWMVSLPAMFMFFKLLRKLKIRLVHVSGLQEAKLAAYPCAWAKVPMVWVVAP